MRHLAALLAGMAAAYAAGPRFEVASVRPSVPGPRTAGSPNGRDGGGGCPQTMRMDRGRVEIRCSTLASLIGYAFRLSPERITGPDWLKRPGPERFDVIATLPAGGSERQVPEMLQTLLAERFQLALHRGNSEQPIYALVIAKGGLKLKPAAGVAEEEPPVGDGGFFGETQTHAGMIANPRMGTVKEIDGPNRVQRWEAAAISMEGLADLVDHVAPVSLPVIDGTGLGGRYQMVLQVALNDLPPKVEELEDAVVRAFNEGLGKIGLRLERRKGTVAVLVVDRVRKAPTEN